MKHLEDGGAAVEAPKSRNRNSFTDKVDKDDDEDDEVNVDEENEGGNKVTPMQQISVKVSSTKPSKQTSAEDEEPSFESYDFSILDELFGLLNDGEVPEPILCGYFNKIITGLLAKIKIKLLQYLLLHRPGDIFDKLLANLQHHSLAQLLVELLQVKVVQSAGSSQYGSSQRRGEGFTFHGNKSGGDSGDDDDEENGKSEQESKLSPLEAKMVEVLNRKRQEVLTTLIDFLGPKNSDFEKCLNAHLDLLEVADSSNEFIFGRLIEAGNVQRLINHACDMRNPNQAYTLNALSVIVKEFPNYENTVTQQ
jgi:hypothetical protein